jgi:hypothetical protein
MEVVHIETYRKHVGIVKEGLAAGLTNGKHRGESIPAALRPRLNGEEGQDVTAIPIFCCNAENDPVEEICIEEDTAAMK